ncbi:MAG TPA: hypothetical protein VGR57_00950 [Ktedonobacterales bacterium]|nr:hypothetical protein [Ktedonobacterales bacterium]
MGGREPTSRRQGGHRRRRAGAWQGAVLAALVALVTVAALGLGAAAVAATPGVGQHRAVTVGVSDAQMQAAVSAAGWPQQRSNWCGVAAIAAVASFMTGGVSQASVAGFLNSSAAVSVWGTPPPLYGGAGFPANISQDTGTDPRAIARGEGGMTGGLYHNIVDDWGAFDSTFHLAVDLRDSHQPVTVIVDGGQHSVVVSAIFANGDPIADPGSIYALEVWDPGVGAFNAGIQAQQREIVGINDWLYDGVYWGSLYDDIYDPDPSVGVYAGKDLWTWHRVYIRPWGLPYVSADWAMNQWGEPLPGLHGEYPPGYTPPTPTPTPTPTATPTPLPIRLARAAPTAPATAGPQSAAVVALNATTTPDASAARTAGAAQVALAPPGAATPAPTSGWCVGPYCVTSADLPWWAATLGCVLLLAILWGAILTRARRADAALATGPPGGE